MIKTILNVEALPTVKLRFNRDINKIHVVTIKKHDLQGLGRENYLYCDSSKVLSLYQGPQ